MCGLMFFFTDIGMQIVNKAQLDRVSYSLVTVMKDRKKIGFQPGVTDQDCQAVKEIADRLMGQDMGVAVHAVASPGRVLGVRLPVVRSSCSSGPACQVEPISDELVLPKKLSLAVPPEPRETDTYQVTVCNATPSAFSQFMSGVSDQFSQQSSSVMIGRNIDPQ